MLAKWEFLISFKKRNDKLLLLIFLWIFFHTWKQCITATLTIRISSIFLLVVCVLTKMHFHVRKTFWIFFFIIHATIIRLFHFFFHDVQIVEMHSKGNNQIYARIWFLMIFVWMYDWYEALSRKKGLSIFKTVHTIIPYDSYMYKLTKISQKAAKLRKKVFAWWLNVKHCILTLEFGYQPPFMCFIFGRNVAVLFATDNNLNKGWSKTIMATVKTYKFKFVTVQKRDLLCHQILISLNNSSNTNYLCNIWVD